MINTSRLKINKKYKTMNDKHLFFLISEQILERLTGTSIYMTSQIIRIFTMCVVIYTERTDGLSD